MRLAKLISCLIILTYLFSALPVYGQDTLRPMAAGEREKDGRVNSEGLTIRALENLNPGRTIDDVIGLIYYPSIGPWKTIRVSQQHQDEIANLLKTDPELIDMLARAISAEKPLFIQPTVSKGLSIHNVIEPEDIAIYQIPQQGYVMKFGAKLWDTLTGEEKMVALAHEIGHICCYRILPQYAERLIFEQINAFPQDIKEFADDLYKALSDWEVVYWQFKWGYQKSPLGYIKNTLTVARKDSAHSSLRLVASSYGLHYLRAVKAFSMAGNDALDKQNELDTAYSKDRLSMGTRQSILETFNNILTDEMLIDSKWRDAARFVRIANTLYAKIDALAKVDIDLDIATTLDITARSAYESRRAEGGGDRSNFITNLGKGLQIGVREAGLTVYEKTAEGISPEAQEAALNILTRLSGIWSTKLTNTHLAVVQAGGIGLLYYKFYLTVFDLRTGKPAKGLKKRRIQSEGNATAVYLSDTYAASYFRRGVLGFQSYCGIVNLSTSEELQIDIPLMPIGEDNAILTNTQFSSTYMYGGTQYLNMVDLSGQKPAIRFSAKECPSWPILRPDYVAVGGSGIITLYDPHTGDIITTLPATHTWAAGDRFVVAHSYRRFLPAEENQLTIYDTATAKTVTINTPFLEKHRVELMVTGNYLIIGPDSIEWLVRRTGKDLFSSIDLLLAGKVPISENPFVVIDLSTGTVFRADCDRITETANHLIVHQSPSRQTIVCDKRTRVPVPGLSAVKGDVYKGDIANSHIVVRGKGRITIYNLYTGTALLSLPSDDLKWKLIPGIGQKDYIWLMGWSPTSINCALLLDGDTVTPLYPNVGDFRNTGLPIDILTTLPLPQNGPLRIEGLTVKAIEDQI